MKFVPVPEPLVPLDRIPVAKTLYSILNGDIMFVKFIIFKIVFDFFREKLVPFRHGFKIVFVATTINIIAYIDLLFVTTLDMRRNKYKLLHTRELNKYQASESVLRREKGDTMIWRSIMTQGVCRWILYLRHVAAAFPSPLSILLGRIPNEYYFKESNFSKSADAEELYPRYGFV
jgi:hypothetical protein